MMTADAAVFPKNKGLIKAIGEKSPTASIFQL